MEIARRAIASVSSGLAIDPHRTHFVVMLTGWIVLLIAVVGLLLWALATNALVKRAGEIAFACGLLATCFGLIGRAFHLP